MYEVLERETLAPGLVLLRIRAPQVALKAKPGQFIIVRADEFAERIPLSLADWDEESVTVIVQDVGVSTRKLCALTRGDLIFNLAGPLGASSRIEKCGTVAVVSGCFGSGPGYALAKALKEAGSRVIYIVEARNRDWAFWLDRIEGVSDRLTVTCNDGSAEAHNATGPLQQILRSERIDRVYAIGCTFMMMEISKATEPFGIPTRVSLMPLMVDGTGMCGACRCSVGGEVKFGCVDGPEFDGHKVDWSLLIERMRSYLEDEMMALDLWERENWHRALERKKALH
ncbi:MAG: sulfide/dihydroorotate dehydrogenase-like FAD/NAD-binding protein [Methanothrix sp.]|nr:sulfide/dihydroorotate dehydrogenase-like FAD/NAD-binding protein [Methanothrix sp.]